MSKKTYVVTETYAQLMDCSHYQEVEANSMEEAIKVAQEKGEWVDWDCEESVNGIYIAPHDLRHDFLVEDRETNKSQYFEAEDVK